MQITGLDLSLTATGIARLVVTDTGEHTLEATTVTSSGSRDDTYAQRAARLEQLKGAIVHETTGADLVVIEGPSYGSAGSGTWDRAGLWWLVVSWLQEVAPVGVLPPSTLKSFATGKGGASKEAMAVALYKRAGEETANDNETDAAWLAMAGAQWLNSPVVSLPAAQVGVLTKGEWPDDWTIDRSGLPVPGTLPDPQEHSPSHQNPTEQRPEHPVQLPGPVADPLTDQARRQQHQEEQHDLAGSEESPHRARVGAERSPGAPRAGDLLAGAAGGETS